MPKSIIIFWYKLKHFYFNKYVLKLFKRDRYYMSYSYRYKALWFRTYKVASRTIDQHLKDESGPGQYIYGSRMPYSRLLMRGFFKFAFVRHPEERFISCWADKVLSQNYFGFSTVQHERMKDLDNFLSWVETQNISNCDEHLMAQTALIDLNHIDFLGRFENFDRDFALVAEKLGIKYENTYKLNVGKGNKSIEINAEQRSRIQELYERDYRILYPISFRG